MTEKEAIMGGAPFSAGMKAGNTIYVSGQVPIEDGKTPVDVGEQTRICLDKIKGILEKGNAKLTDIVKITVFLTDIADFGVFNEAYKKYFINHGIETNFPARAAMAISALVKPEWKVEIDCFAII
ncbi:2-iminobutanoate/2-iminopropanoate deaminase [Candidatus Lokiarchaeum ossiferum]|uniref:2-iminobutanoate/2-iminopropanoate deaminase n=1 Tax=Candidatus Lokiarchaeum ossiferum TaxID=2951803 RepID=A0ABY6HRW3_9ARCH|nr:2-iminobutanoate/2-iminopropanoate deaminase [Candidatus Lokiarchaeum sp. B-35]